jgi:hypothetical protein
MAEKYTLTQEFKGYVNKPEPTNIDSKYIVEGSVNVTVNIDGSIGSRKGATLIDTDITEESTPIDTEKDWLTSRGDYFTLRRYGTKLDVIYTEGGVDKIERLNSSLTVGASKGDFAIVFDPTAVIDKIVLATGTSKLWMWTGAFVEVSAYTSTTLTIASGTWGAKGFPATGSVVVGGVAYTYTGGFDTDTLTGVTASGTNVPATVVGKKAFAPVVEETLTDVDSTYKIDYLGVYRNQLYLGSDTSRLVPVSSGINYKLFTIPATRAAGNPNEFLLDDNSKGFMATKQSMLMFGANNTVMEVKYALSADQTKEAFTVDHVISGDNQGSLSARARLSVGGNIYYINRDLQMAIIQTFSTGTQSSDVNPSELVQNDFDRYDWTDSQMKYWKRNIVLVIPKHNTLMIFDLDQKLWQAPQVFQNVDIGSVSVTKDNRLIGHSYTSNVSYILFDSSTSSDIGVAFPSKAVFAYNQFGDRTLSKAFNLYYQDGYISSAGELVRTIKYDYNGSSGTDTKSFKGINSNFIFDIQDNASIGGAPLGERPLSGGGISSYVNEKRFRYIHAMPHADFYEMQVSYEMEITEGSWRLVAHGPNVQMQRTSSNELIDIV